MFPQYKFLTSSSRDKSEKEVSWKLKLMWNIFLHCVYIFIFNTINFIVIKKIDSTVSKLHRKRTLTRSDRNKTSLTIPFHEVTVSLIMYNLLAGTSANKWFQLPIFLFFLPPFMKLRYLHLSVQQNDRSRSHNSVLVFCCSFIKRTSGCGHTVAVVDMPSRPLIP